VTIFVWSTRPNASSTAHLLTACRASTTSSDDRIWTTSLTVVGIFDLRSRRSERSLEQRHAAFDVERRADAVQRQPELDERDRHGGLHADDDRLGVEDARHLGDVAEHSADEGVDDLERGDVDEDAVR